MRVDIRQKGCDLAGIDCCIRLNRVNCVMHCGKHIVLEASNTLAVYTGDVKMYNSH